MRYLEELKPIEITNERELKEFLKNVGVKEKCIDKIKYFNVECTQSDFITLFYEITTNLGILMLNLYKTNSNETLYSRLTYWEVDGYEFNRNVNLPYPFKKHDNDALKFTYIER